MTKRKPLGLNSGMGHALRQAVTTPSEGEGRGYHSLLTLSQIQVDPDNHRDLSVQPEHLRTDLGESCPPDMSLAEHLAEIEPDDAVQDGVELSERGRHELKGLLELASTIATAGIVQSLRAYRRGDVYVLVAGERRYLAAILAGRPAVPVYVYQDPPSEQEVKLVQYIENKLREDLSPRDEILALRKIVSTMAASNGGEPPELREISAWLGVSKTQASRIRALGGMPDDVVEAVEREQIRSVPVAARIASEGDLKRRAEMIRTVSNTGSVRAALNALDELEANRASDPSSRKRRTRSTTAANLGKVPPRAAHRVLQAVLEHKDFAELREVVGTLPEQPTRKHIEQAWKRLIEALAGDEKA